jgi:hypothetical protein
MRLMIEAGMRRRRDRRSFVSGSGIFGDVVRV